MIVDVTSHRGEQFSWVGGITKGGQPYPLTWAGASVVFTAKRSRTDSTPLVRKSSDVAGEIDLGAPGVYTVSIETADTSDFERTELLEYDVELTEADGTVTVVAEGTWRVRLAVGS